MLHSCRRADQRVLHFATTPCVNCTDLRLYCPAVGTHRDYKLDTQPQMSMGERLIRWKIRKQSLKMILHHYLPHNLFLDKEYQFPFS